MRKLPISVLVLTLNEEVNLPACLRSVAWSDDIVVFDSISQDKTIRIAEDFGARIHQRAFDDENSHRTASLEVPFKYRWVFNPDADEIATPELVQEMALCTEKNSEIVAYRMRRKDIFLGRWLKHSGLYPVWVMRLFQPERVSFRRRINLEYVVNGPEAKLQEHLLHFTFAKGIEAWVEKHNRYSSWEAREALEIAKTGQIGLRKLLSTDPVKRRKAMKGLSYQLPFRPTLRFLFELLWKRSFLDGWHGIQYSRLIAGYEYLVYLKQRELALQRSLGDPHRILL